MLKITFDSAFDQGCWPGPLAKQQAADGELWVGPLGLLNVIETFTGLRGPGMPNALRTASLVPAIRSIKGFWSRSAEVDPFGTAGKLLEWRDYLWLHGWRGKKAGKRLDELARVTVDVLPGIPDRLINAGEAILDANNTISELVMFEPVSDLSHAWRTVINTLEKTGTRIVLKTVSPAKTKGDLAACRKTSFQPKGDGTLQLLRPLTPGAAAHETAAWLSGLKDLKDTVIIGPDSTLDEALQRFGLPATGAGIPVYDNSILQILPLVLAMAFDPPDPQRALELLTLPVSPVPRGIAFRLIHALHEYPAVGSDKWNQAMQAGLDAIEDSTRRERLKQRLDAVFHSSIKKGHYPVSEIRARIDLIRSWAKGRMNLEEEGIDWQPLTAQMENAQRLVELSGLKEFTASQIRRMIQDITLESGTIPLYESQAGLSCVGAPECMVASATNVVWWSFNRDAARSVTLDPFSPEERKSLKDIGVLLPDPGDQAMRNAGRWQRPLLLSTDHLILVCSETGINGEEQYPHPLWDEIVGRMKDGSAHLLEKKQIELPGKPALKKRKSASFPKPEERLKVKPSLIQKRTSESANSLTSLFECPFQWVLSYPGQIAGGITAVLSRPEELEGWFIHEILNRVLEQGMQTPQAAAKLAGEIFDQQGPRLAAQFFLPGYDDLRARMRRSTETAAKQLFRTIKTGGFRIRSHEQSFTLKVTSMGIDLEGRPDLVLDQPTAIIDFKRGGVKYRKEEITEGTSIQLTVYGHLIRGGEKKPFPPVAYFMVKAGQMVAAGAGIFLEATEVEAPPLDDTWNAIKNTYSHAWKELDKGEIRIPGNQEELPGKNEIIDNMIVLKPCTFCGLGVLCGNAF